MLAIKKRYIVGIILGCITVGVAFLLFVHPDVIETSNHAYVLLGSISKGRLLHFYEDVIAHQDSLYYVNFAHYNVIVYLIFALAELPVFLVSLFAGITVNEALLYYLGKAVSVAFFAGCAVIVGYIARQLGIDRITARWAALFFAFWPPAFFSSVVMGQYDSIGLFFALMGLLYWLRKKYWPCTLWFGVGLACKFLPALFMLPLLLLIEKRPLKLLRYGLASLWLVLPTTLLFWGRDGDMSLFNRLMIDRLFASVLPGTIVPLFPVFLLALCFWAWLHHTTPTTRNSTGIWLCLAACTGLFLLVEWHPQWLIYLGPFAVLATFLQRNRTPWLLLGGAFTAACFLLYAYLHPGRLEANLLDFGLLGLFTGYRTGLLADGYNTITFYYDQFAPMLYALALALFGGTLVCFLLFTAPRRGSPLVDGGMVPLQKPAIWLAATFLIGMAVWFLPTVFTWLKAFSVL